MEKHYYHDGEQQLRFSKKIHIKTQGRSKKRDILAMLSFYFLRRTKIYHTKRRNPISLSHKSRTHQMSYSTWRKLT